MWLWNDFKMKLKENKLKSRGRIFLKRWSYDTKLYRMVNWSNNIGLLVDPLERGRIGPTELFQSSSLGERNRLTIGEPAIWSRKQEAGACIQTNPKITGKKRTSLPSGARQRANTVKLSVVKLMGYNPIWLTERTELSVTARLVDISSEYHIQACKPIINLNEYAFYFNTKICKL